MAKLVFPSVGKPHRGYLGEVRGWLRNIATYLDRQPGAKAAVALHIGAFNTQMGMPIALPNTQAIVTNAQKITGVTGEGTVANIAVDPATKAVTVTLTES